MNGIAERMASSLLERLGVNTSPPIDVAGIASALGVERICSRDQVEDGRLERNAESAVIYVKAGARPQRRRFTVAHELGHLLLTGDGPDVAAYRAGQRTNEERFCDDFAASLLLPRAWVQAHFKNCDEKLETLRELSAQSRTSMSAAAVRLNEVAGWNSALLQWRRGDDGWRFRFGSAIPVTMRGHVRSAPTTSFILDRLTRHEADVRVQLPVSIQRTVVEVAAEISVRGRSALALVPVKCFQGIADHGRPD